MAPVVEVCVFSDCKMQVTAEDPETLRSLMKDHVQGVHIDRLVRERQLEMNGVVSNDQRSNDQISL